MAWLYDVERTRARLGDLEPWARTAFAAACAERMLHVYRDGHATTGHGDVVSLERCLGAVWDALLGEGAADLAEASAEAERLVPDEDLDPWFPELPYIGNAAAAVAYAARTLVSDDDVRNAEWAARQVFEAIDYHLTRNATDDAALQRGLSAPLVERELRRQQQDLDALRVTPPGETRAVVLRLREAARVDGPPFGGSGTSDL